MRTIITLFALILSFATFLPYTSVAQLNILSTNPNVSSSPKTLPQDKGQPNVSRTDAGNRNPNLGNPNNGRPNGNGHNTGHGHHNGHGHNTGRPGRPNNNGHNTGHGHGHGYGHHNGNTHNGPTTGHGHGHHYHVAMCDADFEELYNMAAQFYSSFDRMDILEKQIPRYYFTNCQIERLAKLFYSSFDRMDIMKIAFHQSIEQDSYHHFTKLFYSSFDKRDLLEYIDDHIHHHH